jgi:hypothetical protein
MLLPPQRLKETKLALPAEFPRYPNIMLLKDFALNHCYTV